MIAVALIVCGAIFLFWPRGGSKPTGIGERISVVTAENSTSSSGLNSEPRSGDVTIDDEVPKLVPEPKDDGAATGSSPAKSSRATAGSPPETQASSGPAENEPDVSQTKSQPAASQASSAAEKQKPVEKSQATQTPEIPRSAQQKSEPPPPPPPALQPMDRGGWAIQLGAFGSEENAAKLINKLQQKGYVTRLHTANTSSGGFLHKVWIGYFKTREDAVKYARQHRQQIGEAIPVHR
jgi:cell division septation protein DedD